ncbi:Na+ dependent nucleoside transporter N-terminal domain-containing protein, partial [Candidatus Latescibacterota bacterium]
MSVYNVISFLGIFVLLGFAWLCSADRRVLNLRLIAWGVGLQVAFALLIFTFPPGARVFLWVNDMVVVVMSSAAAGAE